MCFKFYFLFDKIGEHVQSSVDTMHSVEMTFENDYEENTIEEMNHEYSKLVVNM